MLKWTHSRLDVSGWSCMLSFQISLCVSWCSRRTCGGGVKSNDKRLPGENVCFIVGPSVRFRILIKLFDPQHVAPGWERGERRWGRSQHEDCRVKLSVAANAPRPLPVNVNILLLVGLLPQPLTLHVGVGVCSVKSVDGNIKRRRSAAVFPWGGF